MTVKNSCDIGVAIDADGDRLGIADEKGNVIWPDRWFILLSRLVLKKHPGAKIVFDVKVSEALPEDIKAHGGVPIMWKTGHSYIKQKLHEEKAAAAGEMSGHIFFVDDFYGFDDANFAGLKLLEYVSSQGRPLSKLIEETPYYVSTPAYHAPVPDEIKYGVVEKLTEEFKTEGYKVIDINGARVYFEEGCWGLIRASSNLPALVLRFEAKSEEKLKEIEKIFREKLKKFPKVGQKWESA
jgi:phosphomannomutase/phosphoglucomutase